MNNIAKILLLAVMLCMSHAAHAKNQPPTISSISPGSGFTSDPSFTLTVTGTNYVSNSVVNLNGSALTTTYVSATSLTATVANPPAGTDAITVTNPTTSLTSNAANFIALSCGQPSNAPAGLTLTCQCDSFNRTSLNPSTFFNGSWLATTSDSTGQLPTIVNPGYLRLTWNTGNNAKAVTAPSFFPAAGNYISVEFTQYAYNGTNPGADGMAVILSDYSIPAVPGAFGGSLGYAQKTGPNINGFAGGWVGVALDDYGNYQNPTEGRIGGPGFIPESVGMRGSGSGVAGYNYLGGTSQLPASAQIDDPTSKTAQLGYLYQVIVDARTAATSITVNRDTTSTGTSYAQLINIPNVFTANPTQLALPAYWQLSFTGSTGGSDNIHELGMVRVCAQTMIATSSGVAGGFNAIDSAYGTPPSVAAQNYLTGHIYTKLMGTPFSLNVAALSNNQIVQNYGGTSGSTVQVKLVDNSNSIGNSSLDCTQSCTSTCAAMSAIPNSTQLLTFTSAANLGQKQTSSFTVNSAYQKLVAVMRECTSSACTAFTSTAPACSTDAFSVRPISVSTVTSSNATGTTGNPTFKAANTPFALTATIPGVTGNANNYSGVLQINSNTSTVTYVQGVSSGGASIYGGNIAGTFAAAVSGTPNSTATGSTFTYDDVGQFTLLGLTSTQAPSVFDSTWTIVDSVSTQGDCNSSPVAAAYSNTIDANGKYGCYFGLSANAGPFGRFIPDHFDTFVVQTGTSPALVPMICASGLTCPTSVANSTTFNGMVYALQPFTTNVYARNALGNTTLNYDSAAGYAKAVTLSADTDIYSTSTSTWSFSQLSTTTGSITSGATVPSTSFSKGTTGSSLINGTTYNGVSATPAVALYASPLVPIPIPTPVYVRATDTDSVTSVGSIEGGVEVVSGRFFISSAYGSDLLPLSGIQAQAQYYSATNGWVLSTTDYASTLLFPASYAIGSGTASVNTPLSKTVSGGSLNFSLSAPNAAGSAVMNPTTAPAYLPVTPGTATFGIYQGNPSFIYMREQAY